MPTLTFARAFVLAILAGAAAAGPGVSAALAQQPPAAAPRGYEDPEGVPVRPRAIDIEPVWARPAIDTLATVRKRGTLRVGVVPSEPFVMRDASGELTGFSIDLGRQLAADMGVEVEFVPTSWTQVVADLVGNHFDLIASGLWVTPTRALVVNFTAPTSFGGVHLVASRARAGAFRTRQDFDRPEVRLVVHAGTAQESLATRLFPTATLVKVEGDADPLAAVVEGQAHAAIVTTPVPRVVVEHTPDRLFLPFDTALHVTSTAMAVRKGDADFLNFLDSWLAFQREGGWLTDRHDHWFRGTSWAKGL